MKQLCKSMIMENTKLAEKPLAQCQAEGKVKFVCVVVQYDGPKLHKEKLTEIVRAPPCSMTREGRASISQGEGGARSRAIAHDVRSFHPHLTLGRCAPWRARMPRARGSTTW